MPPSEVSEIHVRLEGVTKTFPGKRRKDPAQEVLRGVDLEIRKGEIFGVIGQSGAGKSTLVRLINGLEPVTSGRLTVGGRTVSGLRESELREVRRDIGMIFQQFNLFRSRTVAGNVAYPLKVAGVPRAERDAKVARLLDFVGLLARAHDHPEQLSGGQQQRVGIARALATDPSLLLADEATSALDPETTQDVLNLLRQVNRELGITIVIITHEMDVIRSIADRVAVIDKGVVIESGSAYDIFDDPKTPEARRFVSSTLRDRPSPDTLRRLRAGHPGRLVTVRVQDRPGFQTTLSSAFLERDVSAQIVFGGISELQERPVGSLTFALSGSDASIDAALGALKAEDFVIDEHEEATA